MTAQELKNSILQYAVQGKLVPQDPNDEPASELLKRIQVEKQQLIKDKKIKAEKALQLIREEDIPFDLPDNWEWVRLGEIANKLTDGTHYTPKYTESGIPFLSVKDMSSGKLDFSNTKYISAEEHNILYSRCNPEKGDLLLTKVGTTGIPVIIDTDKEFSLFVSVALIKFTNSLIDSRYLVHLINSPLVQIQCTNSTRGVGNKNWVMRDIANTLISIPPLPEQQRIVDKIEELMPMVEEYDKAEKELTGLNKAFPEQIKKSILQYAIQGKLVPQNPQDEPASALLAKIKVEKAQLIKDKKIKAEKPLPAITEDEKPFDIPESWEWVKLGEIAIKLTDGTHYTPKYTESGIPFLSVKDMSSGKLDFSNTKYISIEEHKVLYNRCNPEKGDLLLTKVGTTGIPVIVNTDKEFSLFVSVALIKFNHSYIDSKYFIHLINSPLVQIQCTNATRGVGNKNWVMRDIANTVIALPPLSEQKLIVEKVEELLAECEKLQRN